MAKNSVRIAAMREVVEQLGVRGARGTRLPPLDARRLAAAEKRLGVRLPDEVRAFFGEVLGGEQGSGLGDLLSPDAALTALPKGSRPSSAFPLKSAKSSKPVDVPWDGLLPVLDDGDGEYVCVVLDGPLRGSMWRAGEAGVAPLEKKPIDFLTWAERWLDDALAAAPAPIDASATELEPETFSDALFECTRLRRLVATRGAVAALSPRIGELTALRDLTLQLEMKSLPDELGALKHLERLNLEGNALRALPDAIGKLGALQVLLLAHNQLEALPDSIGALSKLRELTIAGNPLRALPERFGALHLEKLKLDRLPKLDLKRVVPVLARMPKLTSLELYGEGSKVPSLSGFSRLRRLALRRFGLRELPAELTKMTKLESLMLDSNELRTIPDEVLALPKLTSVVLFRNPIDKREVERLRAAFPRVQFSA